ncbi:hypothetical protein BJ741DRAFT_622183 [Chytriomyces cf. hyalinus JEL632]|nr:hypothetical protein BJ741DRAFT_622183 [Chytriomyces cf. hyalinus JEL632]
MASPESVLSTMRRSSDGDVLERPSNQFPPRTRTGSLAVISSHNNTDIEREFELLQNQLLLDNERRRQRRAQTASPNMARSQSHAGARLSTCSRTNSLASVDTRVDLRDARVTAGPALRKSRFQTTNPLFDPSLYQSSLNDEEDSCEFYPAMTEFSPVSDTSSHRRPSNATDITLTYSPSSFSTLSPSLIHSSRSFTNVPTLKHGGSRPILPSEPSVQVANVRPRMEHYPSNMAPLSILLMSSQIIHGAMHRSQSYKALASPTTDPNRSTSVVKETTSLKSPLPEKRGFFSFFTKKPASAAPQEKPSLAVQGGAAASTPAALAAQDSASKKLASCVIGLLGDRMYVYDNGVPVNCVFRNNGVAKKPSVTVLGPLSQENTPFAAAGKGISAVSGGAAAGIPLPPKGRSRAGSLSSTTTSFRVSNSSNRPMYPQTLLDARPRMVLELTNACVSENGIWMLKVSGNDLSQNGEAVDVFFQAAECEEMVRWLSCFRAAAGVTSGNV